MVSDMSLPLPTSLSPSKVASFRDCALAFRFATIDRLPEPTNVHAVKGTLVHRALELLLWEEPQGKRTLSAALDRLVRARAELATDREFVELALTSDDDAMFVAEAEELLRRYFQLEDPNQVQAIGLELMMEVNLGNLRLRGIIDRLEVRPDGSWILSDYKTGRVPGETRELRAFFGLRFYALVCWRSFGVIPKEIRLVYLSDPAVLTLNPHERMLIAFERQMQALGTAIRRALDLEDWRARPSPFCMSCSFQKQCPAWAMSEPRGSSAGTA